MLFYRKNRYTILQKIIYVITYMKYMYVCVCVCVHAKLT